MSNLRDALLGLGCLFSLPSFAHPLDVAYLQLEQQGHHIRASLDVHPTLAAELSTITVDDLVAGRIEAQADRLRDVLLATSTLTAGGAPCVWGKATAERANTSVRSIANATCEGSGEIRLDFPLLAKLPPTYQILGKLVSEGQESVFRLAPGEPTAVLQAEAPSFSRFIAMGIEHIGAAPSEWRSDTGGVQLPDGIDHILFLLALILGGGSLLEMLKTVTGFTVGHSVTLALALLGVVRLPVRLVESLVALSIAVVAFEAVRRVRPSPHQWKMASGFGLIHGLGFAAALGDLGLTRWNLVKALVGYNVGIEMGQALIVALLLPIIIVLRKRPVVARYATASCAVLITIVGLYWFVQRSI